MSVLTTEYSTHKLVLWVEDTETRGYLGGLFQDRDLRILVAPGVASVQGAVEDAYRSGHKNVFGLIDRDFKESNIHLWSRPDTWIFIHLFHEVENYLLDNMALAQLPTDRCQRRTEADIQSRIVAEASRQTWYMATRTLLSRFVQIVGAAPRHPKPQKILNQQNAQDWVKNELDKICWKDCATSGLYFINDPQEPTTSLSALERDYQDTLHDNRWLKEFSGKEILCSEQVMGWLKRTGVSSEDFFRAVGETQRRLNRIPPELYNLHTILRQRAHLPLLMATVPGANP